LRRDLEDIVYALKHRGRAPFVVVTTNAALLTKDRYDSLIRAGVDEFSVSLDYPDPRHDEFRAIPGLFGKIENLVNQVRNKEASRITFSCVVQNDNFRELNRLAQLAVNWNVKINFSTYTWLRTQDKTYMIPKENLPELRVIADRLLAIRKANKNVFASDYVFKRMIQFYENEGIPNCRAGERFFIVNPDGTLSPCGLIQGSFTSVRQLKRDFISVNRCADCNTSIRANCEKPLFAQVTDNLNTLFA
jgi:MoaA/NifB/PqqE/SkfB family radical SAM enzyme